MLAKKFCFKNNIDPRVIALLTNNIQNAKMASFGKAKGDYRETLNDKENKSMLQNTDLSGNSKCSKAEVRRSVKGGIRPKEWIEESRTNEGGTTMQSQKSYISVFDRLYQDSRHKAMRKSIQLPGGNYTPIALSHNRMSSQLQHSQTNQSLNNSVSSCLQIYDKNTKLKYSAQKKNESLL